MLDIIFYSRAGHKFFKITFSLSKAKIIFASICYYTTKQLTAGMIEFITQLTHNTWQLVAEMAPYLLFGFAIAGCLHGLIKPEFVRKSLGRPGIGTVINACLIGVPMPLCSCSVIPVAASLRNSGASRGATASFLSATPQTGIDSILATYALMGGVFTIVRVIVAFITGFVAGTLVDLFAKEKVAPAAKPSFAFDTTTALRPSLQPTTVPRFNSLAPQREAPQSCGVTKTPQKFSLRTILRYGFITLPADLATALIVGLLLAGLITTVMPSDLLTGNLSHGIGAFLLATVISLPLYVCATASIPMAYALIAAGLSPGAALIFLIVGPATNTATVVAVWKMLGQRATLIYIASLVAVSWTAGALFNASFSANNMTQAIHHHDSMQLAPWQHAAGVLMTALLVGAIIKKILSTNSKSTKSSCCHA